ncbi:hypothetical protein Dimus_005739 [Dionaea muscipula]
MHLVVLQELAGYFASNANADGPIVKQPVFVLGLGLHRMQSQGNVQPGQNLGSNPQTTEADVVTSLASWIRCLCR